MEQAKVENLVSLASLSFFQKSKNLMSVALQTPSFCSRRVLWFLFFHTVAACLCLHAEENALLEAGRERIGDDCVIYCNT